MLLINLDILKFFINGRNSFIIKEREKLGPYKNAILNLNENQIISKYNKQVETNLLNMTTNITKKNGALTITPTDIPSSNMESCFAYK